LLGARPAAGAAREDRSFERVVVPEMPEIAAATDDWPYLYSRKKPFHRLRDRDRLPAGGLAGGSGRIARPLVRTDDAHFALLGMGFLLLETKSIGDCSLYFGATWLVTLLVVTGVLLMVLGANLVAGRMRAFQTRSHSTLRRAGGVVPGAARANPRARFHGTLALDDLRGAAAGVFLPD